MNENIYKVRYKVTQHSVENIQIVEIQEIGYEYFDYVVIRHDESCDAQILKSLIDEYKPPSPIVALHQYWSLTISLSFSITCP